MARVWIALALAAFLSPAAAQSGAITVYASVTDKAGHFVADLTPADFILKDDGQVRPMATVVRDTSPVTLVLLMDRSGSMKEVLPQVDALSLAVIDGLQSADRLRLGQLAPMVLALDPPDFSGDRTALRRAFISLTKPDTLNGTGLWNALDVSITAFDRITTYRAVLVLSDGADTASKVSRSDVVTHAQRAGVLIHAVEISPPPFRTGQMQTPMMGPSPELKPLAEDVGGGYWKLPSGGDVAALAAQVNEGLRARYAITFVPRSMDGKMHKLELGTTRRDISVRTPKKYLASSAQR
jgi:VWFA-related protein